MGRRGKRKDLIVSFLDFVITLNLLSIPLYLIMYFNLELQILKELEAFIVSEILKVFGLNTKLYENFVVIDDKVYEISWDSTGWKSFYTFFALVISTPIFYKRKVNPLLIGLLSIFLFNILRITITIYLSHKNLAPFYFLHLSLWRWGSIGFLLFIWLIFLYTQRNNIGEAKNIMGIVWKRKILN